MSRTLTILFRRDPLRDRQAGNVDFAGYEVLWPDGKPVAVGLDAFCRQGQRLLGLNRHLAGVDEKLVKMVCLPLQSRDDDVNRIPGYRVRRFYIERKGPIGRAHFMDGTPTTVTFDVIRDDPRVLHWLYLNDLADGEVVWFDIAAVNVDTAIPHQHRKRLQAVEAKSA